MTVGELIAVIGADTSQLRVGVAQANQQLGSLKGSAQNAAQGLSEIDRVTGKVKTALGAIGALQVGRTLIGMADTSTLLAAKIRLVTDSQEEFADVSERVFRIAQETRTGLEGTVTLYARLARSTKELGTSQSTLLRVTETINKALIVSGATAQEAEASLIQLSQGLASGALRGDELRSVLEQMPAVARLIAAEFGVSIGELRKLGAEGALTADRIITAISKASGEIDEQFSQIPKTVGQAFVQLQNEALRSVGALNEGTGAAKALAGALGLVADNLNAIAAIGGTLLIGRGLLSLLGTSKRLLPVLTQTKTVLGAHGEILGEVTTATGGAANATKGFVAQLAALGALKLAGLAGFAILLNEAKNKALEFGTGLDRSEAEAARAAARYETIGKALHFVNESGGAVNVLLPALKDKLDAKLAEASFVARAGGDLTKITAEIQKLKQQLANNPFDAFDNPKIKSDLDGIKKEIEDVRRSAEAELASGEGLTIAARLEIAEAEKALADLEKRIDDEKDPELQLQLRVRHDLLTEELKRATVAGQKVLDTYALDLAVRINSGKGDKSLGDLESKARKAIEEVQRELDASGGRLTPEVRLDTKRAEEKLERFRRFIDEKVSDKKQKLDLELKAEDLAADLERAKSRAQSAADSGEPVRVPTSLEVPESEIDAELARLRRRLGEANVQQAVDLQFRIDELEAEKRRLGPVTLQVQANIAELTRERDRLQQIIGNAPLEQAVILQGRIDTLNRQIAEIESRQVNLNVNVRGNPAQIQAEITRLQTLLNSANVTQAINIQARIDQLQKQLAKARADEANKPVTIPVEADTEPFRSELDQLRADIDKEIAKTRIQKMRNDPGTTGRGAFGVGVDPAAFEAEFARATATGDADALLGVIGDISAALVGLRKEAAAAGRDVIGSFSFGPFLNRNVQGLEALAQAARQALQSMTALERREAESSVSGGALGGAGISGGIASSIFFTDPAILDSLGIIAENTGAGAEAAEGTRREITGRRFTSNLVDRSRSLMQQRGDRNSRYGRRAR